jgi:small subunit ribosomal protein S1
MSPDEKQSLMEESREAPEAQVTSEVVASAPVESSPIALESADPAEVGGMLESMTAPSPIKPGEIMQGRVLKVTEEEVFVDLGLKSEAAVPRAEFLSETGELKVQPGEMIDVWIERFDEHAGILTVSHRKALNEKNWVNIDKAFQDQSNIQGRVLERVKGGLAVDIGVRAFLPGSHVDIRLHPNVDSLIGQEITCKVIKVNQKRGNVVVSRKLAAEEEAQKRRAALAERLVEGAEFSGHVKNLTDYGVFVDLGGMDGLVHVTDLAWGRVAHPSEVVQVGQEIKVKVLKFDPEKQRVSLGLKQLLPDPWERVPSAYHAGDKAKGRVVSTTDYGAFVELEPGIEGLIHISEMSWSKNLKHPSKIVKKGDLAEVVILDVNPEQRRISLSLRQSLPDPWANVAERYAVGSVVQGRVRHMTDFGAFVEVEEGVDGLIHISNLSWTKNVKHPSEVLHKGQKADAVVLAVDAEKRRLSLGLKQLQPDVWEAFFARTQVGDTLRGKVKRMTTFGAFVELEEGIEGLCHVSEFDSDGRGEAGPPTVGSELEFRILRLSPEEKKIGLSMRKQAAPRAAEAAATPAPEPAKPREPAPLSRMAEAFSSAGIATGAAAPTVSAAEAKK